MRAVELERGEWGRCFELLARESALVAVAVAGQRPSEGPEPWRALRSAHYDPHGDAINVDVGGNGAGHALRFIMSSPRRVTIADDRTASVLVVVAADGSETVLRFATGGLAERVGGALDSRRSEWAPAST